MKLVRFCVLRGMQLPPIASITLAAIVACGAPPAHTTQPSSPSSTTSRTVLPAGEQQARPEQLNGKRHVLEVYAGNLSAVALGATVDLRVPAVLGSGHGPFFRVFPGPGAITARTTNNAITVKSAAHTEIPDGPSFSIRCERAGTFELTIDVTDADGIHLNDAIDVGCITPTRFSAENEEDAPGPYLAGASTLRAGFMWFGKLPDGQESLLSGTLPVTPAAGETAIAQRSDREGEFVTRGRATRVSFASAGLTTTLPVEIIDPSVSTWTLDVASEPSHLRTDRGSALSILRPHVVDDRGRSITGLTECTMLLSRGGVASPEEPGCLARIIRRNAAVAIHASRVYRDADRVCFSVLGKTACKDVTE